MIEATQSGGPACVSMRRLTRIWFAGLILAGVFGLLLTKHATAEPATVQFNIPAQSVSSALRAFARQANVQLLVSTQGLEAIQANAVVGSLEPHVALQALLAGTGLRAQYRPDSTVTVNRDGEPDGVPVGSMNQDNVSFLFAQTDGTSDRGSDTGAASSEQRLAGRESVTENSDADRKAEIVDEIVVTGSSIRGVTPDSSPLAVYDVTDIRNTGALTIEQFVTTLPQNNNTLSEAGSGTSSREINSSSTSSADLRGLGVGSTLVLLNGRRMAPSSGARATDISAIPIEAVERVEVLTDGASAIYGADAIGGVINFVLKDQQDGAETSVTFGGAEGGSEQWRIDQSFGFNWADGNALIALSYMDRNALDAGDRDFARAAAPFTLIPEDTRKNVLATVSQLMPGGVYASADLLYTTREPRTANLLTQFTSGADFRVRDIEHEQTVFNLGLDRSFGETLNAALFLTYADASADTDGFSDGATIGFGPFFTSQDTNTIDVTAKIDGELARLPSGALMFALGAGYTEDEFDESRDFSASSGDTPTSLELARDVKYAFGELQIPLVSPEQNVTGVRRFEVNLSARYTDYSDFGENTSPKIGLLWSPIEQLKIRGTFSESFKAPFLPQLSGAGFYFILPVASFAGGIFPDIWSTDDSTVMLFLNGSGNPTLGPEEAENYTLGFDLDFSGLSISATYFNIDYTNRIDNPDTTNGNASLSNPEDFPELFNLNPTEGQIAEILASSTGFDLVGVDTSDPAAVLAAVDVLADNRLRNLAISETDGLDLRIDYTTDTRVGVFQAGINVAKIFSFEDRIFESAPPITRSDTVLFPADLKARGYLGIARNSWSTRLNVNYVDEYDNPFDAANPTIDDWTTVDLLFSYHFAADQGGFSDQLRFGLAVNNVFDEDPPFLPVGTASDLSIVNPTGYDPANSNPLGRFVSFQISKSW